MSVTKLYINESDTLSVSVSAEIRIRTNTCPVGQALRTYEWDWMLARQCQNACVCWE